MKLILFIITFFFGAYGLAQSNHHFKIEIHFKNSEGEKVYLSDTESGGLDRTESAHIDSQYISNGICIFYGEFKNLKYYSLAVDSMRNYASFIIDTGRIVVKGNTNDYLWKSLKVFSPQNNWKGIAEKIVDSLQKIRESIQDSLLKYSGKSEVLALTYSRQMDTVDIQKVRFLISFVRTHPNCFYAFSILNDMYNFTEDVTDLIRKDFYLFSDEIKNSEDGKYLYTHLYQSAESLIGEHLRDFFYFDTSNVISQINIRESKYYLLDYWASWCVPCIRSLPKLSKLQDRFKDGRLKIVSISFDLDSLVWKEAIIKHNIYWINYRDVDSFNSPDAKYFNIMAIPFKILINDKGLIILVNPSIESVERYLLDQQKE